MHIGLGYIEGYLQGVEALTAAGAIFEKNVVGAASIASRRAPSVRVGAPAIGEEGLLDQQPGVMEVDAQRRELIVHHRCRTENGGADVTGDLSPVGQGGECERVSAGARDEPQAPDDSWQYRTKTR